MNLNEDNTPVPPPPGWRECQDQMCDATAANCIFPSLIIDPLSGIFQLQRHLGVAFFLLLPDCFTCTCISKIWWPGPTLGHVLQYRGSCKNQNCHENAFYVRRKVLNNKFCLSTGQGESKPCSVLPHINMNMACNGDPPTFCKATSVWEWDWQGTTWNDYARSVRKVALSLITLGITAGTHLAILGKATPVSILFNAISGIAHKELKNESIFGFTYIYIFSSQSTYFLCAKGMDDDAHGLSDGWNYTSCNSTHSYLL